MEVTPNQYIYADDLTCDQCGKAFDKVWVVKEERPHSTSWSFCQQCAEEAHLVPTWPAGFTRYTVELLEASGPDDSKLRRLDGRSD